MYRDYRNKDVQFFYVYKAVQHPEINNFVSAFTIEERLKHVESAKRMLQTEIPWICDSMDNQVKIAFGKAPNGEFVVDPEGKIVRKRFWSNPVTLRNDLAELVGPSEKVTSVDEIPANLVLEQRDIASGVVPRIKLPAGLRPIKTTPATDSKHPFFAKLRVEATRDVIGGEAGQIYLGLNLDPLYKVHWNNRAGGVSIQIKAPEGMEFSETEFSGPDVKEDADVDPRQFLIDVKPGESKGPIDINVIYTVCDDADTFCTRIIQKYQVELEPDRHLGSRPGIFMPEMFAKLESFDKNKDGNITKDELPEGEVTLYIGHIDYNGNEIIEKSEREKFLQMFNNGRGFDTPFNDGGDAPAEDGDE